MRIVLAIALLLSLAVGEAQEKTVVVGLIGDSTVAEQSGWGPAFAERFDRRAKIVNYAKGGATLKSLSTKLDELVQHQPDYVLIQFGHNDQKRYDTAVYRDHLKSYVERIQQAGGQPVIVSSVTRRSFDAQGKIVSNLVRNEKYSYRGTLTDYANAAEAVAKELNLPFIDLHRASIAHHNKIGRAASMAYNFKEGDKTHFNKKGAEAITGLILEELKTAVPELAAYVKAVAEGPKTSSHVADSARASIRGCGYPKLSDISFSSRRFRPENDRDPHDTFADLPRFFSTRLDWVYDKGNRENIIGRANALGLNYTGAISSILPDDLGGFVRIRGRDRSLSGDLSVLGHLPSKPAIGDVWSDDFIEIASEHVREMIRQGADGIQVDDPGMNYAEAVYRDGGYGDASNAKFPAWLTNNSTEQQRRNWNLDLGRPKFSYREWVLSKGGEDSIPPDLKRLHEKFLLEGLLRFYETLRNAAADANGGAPVPFSCNNSSNVVWRDYSKWADFGMAETRMENISPLKIWRWVCAPGLDIEKGQVLSPPRYDVLTPPDNMVPFTRSCIATTYAMGGLMMVPWDVWQKNGGGPRYFGTAADYADLYGLIRALPELFDGYEAVFCRGEGFRLRATSSKTHPSCFRATMTALLRW